MNKMSILQLLNIVTFIIFVTYRSIANEELTALLLSCNTYDIQQMPQIKTAPNTLLMSRVSKNNVRKVEEFCEVFNLAVSTVFT